MTWHVDPISAALPVTSRVAERPTSQPVRLGLQPPN